LVSFFDITKRKQAEELLSQSENKYRRLVENSPDIVYIFSNKQGGRYYSPRIEKVLGYPAEYFYANPMLWNESIHPDDLEVISQALQASAQGEPFEVDYRIRTVAASGGGSRTGRLNAIPRMMKLS
jgi:PAS domain S-box-containing protein